MTAALELAGRAGQVMLVLAAVIAVIAFIATLPSLVRVGRRALALRSTLLASRIDIESAVALLRARLDEQQTLLAPWRRLSRLLRHPLVVAALAWYRRRRDRRSSP